MLGTTGRVCTVAGDSRVKHSREVKQQQGRSYQPAAVPSCAGEPRGIGGRARSHQAAGRRTSEESLDVAGNGDLFPKSSALGFM